MVFSLEDRNKYLQEVKENLPPLVNLEIKQDDKIILSSKKITMINMQSIKKKSYDGMPKLLHTCKIDNQDKLDKVAKIRSLLEFHLRSES